MRYPVGEIVQSMACLQRIHVLPMFALSSRECVRPLWDIVVGNATLRLLLLLSSRKVVFTNVGASV